MTTAIGQFRHVVSLLQPGTANVEDPDGGWGGDAWDPLVPPTWHCSIQAASLRDLQRLSGGVLSTTATHLLRGRYHPQLTRATRIYFGDRVFDVESVHDLEERRIEHEVIAHEQLGAPGPPAVPYADQVIADGASHYWRLGDLGGTIAIDSVGFAHGTISGGVTLNQPGALMDSNAAMAFDGATGKIVTSGGVVMPAAFTLEVWIKTTQATGLLPILNTPTQNPTNDAMLFDVSDGKADAYWIMANAVAAGFGAPAAIANGQWHHIVFVSSGGLTPQIFIDGVSQTVSGIPLPRAPQGMTGPVELGYRSSGPNWYAGALDEVAIYPLALTPAQIAAHYAARTP